MQLNSLKTRHHQDRLEGIVEAAVKIDLEKIKNIRGVENVLLTQRDGNPIMSAGVWLNKNEVFHVSAATSAMYNVGLSLHEQYLNYMVIEGNRKKILIAPLRIQKQATDSNDEFYIALTTLSDINLGSVFLKLRNGIEHIRELIDSTGCSFKPPLREFNKKQKETLDSRFNSMESVKEDYNIDLNNFVINLDTYQKSKMILEQFNRVIKRLIYSSVACKGGYLVNYVKPGDFRWKPDTEVAMSHNLFQIAKKYAWWMKKMEVNSIYLDCGHYMHFIVDFKGGIFSSFVYQDQRAGYVRMLLPKFLKILEDAFAGIQANANMAGPGEISTLMIR